MAATDIPDVTLASADPAILLCWEEQVKKGVDCSILIKHSRGKITTILTSSKNRNVEAKVPGVAHSPSEKILKKKNKGGKKKRLEKLLSYHQRLVEEKGLPPSRLMLQHSVPAPSPCPPAQPVQVDISENFDCDQCDYTSKSKQGLRIHTGHKHKEMQMLVTCDHFKCVICGMGFNTENCLNDHVNSEHANECDKCDDNASCEAGFNQHISLKHDIIPQLDGESDDIREPVKPYKCKYCLDRVGCKCDLNCYRCDEEYLTKIAFKRHMREKHKEIMFKGLVPYPGYLYCEECDKEYGSRIALWNHMQVEHGRN